MLTHVGVSALDPALEHACNSSLTRGGETDLYCVQRYNDAMMRMQKQPPHPCAAQPLFIQ